MNKLIIPLLTAVLIPPLAACQIAGPYGNQGGSQGKTTATIGGPVLGGLFGHSVGSSLEKTDELKASQALETSRTNQPTTWQNPTTSSEVSITPTHTFQNSGGQTCRDYNTTVYINRNRSRAHGTACRQDDGSWRIVNHAARE